MCNLSIEEIHEIRRKIDKENEGLNSEEIVAKTKKAAAPILARLKNTKFPKTALF